MHPDNKYKNFQFFKTETILIYLTKRIYKPKTRLEKLYSNESFFKRVLNCSASLLRMESFILQVLSKT